MVDIDVCFDAIFGSNLFVEDNPYSDLMEDDVNCQDVVLMTKHKIGYENDLIDSGEEWNMVTLRVSLILVPISTVPLCGVLFSLEWNVGSCAVTYGGHYNIQHFYLPLLYLSIIYVLAHLAVEMSLKVF